MKRTLQKIWFYYLWGIVGLSFIIFFPLQWLLLQKENWHGMAHSFRSLWTRVLLFAGGIRYKIINPEYLHHQKQVIICSNHSSFLDIIVCCAIFKDNTSFMAKTELSNIPLFGLFFRTLDIQVDRDNDEKSAVAYRKAVKKLEKGANLVIYPEGGIYPDPFTIKPLKNGAFQLALRQKIPILPVSFPDNYKIMPDGGKLAKPGKIRIILHEPLTTEELNLSDMESLKLKLKDIIQRDILL
jgi:1-acyl-sn-glycerol-3-phosphate acyltransferase